MIFVVIRLAVSPCESPVGIIPCLIFFVDRTFIRTDPESTSLPPQLDDFFFVKVAQNLELSLTWFEGDTNKDTEGC